MGTSLRVLSCRAATAVSTGTTAYGGANSDGLVFKITSAGVFTILHNFDGADGNYPAAGLAPGSDGNFYGTTADGGANGDGTIFQITPAGVLDEPLQLRRHRWQRTHCKVDARQ